MCSSVALQSMSFVRTRCPCALSCILKIPRQLEITYTHTQKRVGQIPTIRAKFTRKNLPCRLHKHLEYSCRLRHLFVGVRTGDQADKEKTWLQWSHFQTNYHTLKTSFSYAKFGDYLLQNAAVSNLINLHCINPL